MESEVSVFLCEVYDKKIRGILFSYGGRRNASVKFFSDNGK